MIEGTGGGKCACAARLEEVFAVSGTGDALPGSALVGATRASLTGRFKGGTCGSSGLLDEAFALSYTSPCLADEGLKPGVQRVTYP